MLDNRSIESQELPTASRLGAVFLEVRDLEKALTVWRDLLGLAVVARDDRSVAIGVDGRTLVVLRAGSKQPAPGRSLGLYHVALSIPRRVDFARATARLFAARYPNSPTDHLVTEAVYLSDADGNGIELMFGTAERGRVDLSGGRFRGVAADGSRHSGREPLDVDALFDELPHGDDLSAPLPTGTRIGHVHLHVAELERSMAFYSRIVGFREGMRAPVFQMYDVGLGPNPHAVAFNTWSGPDAKQPPDDAARLRAFTLEVPTHADVEQVARRLAAAGQTYEDAGSGIGAIDPDGNRLIVTANAA